ncbi:MAG: glucose-1-phosphate adenylyltransferase [Planctomycetota bacterium]
MHAIGLILGGGAGTRLYPLTRDRAKPAVPVAGKYRLVDIPISNCIHNEIKRIYVLTQFMSVSLHRHIRQTYRFDSFSGGFVEILAAQQTMEAGTDWYEGTADAVRKNIRYLEQADIEYVMILSGDQLYRMDYRRMLDVHQSSGADVTIAAMPVSREDARSLGVMRIDDSGRVVGFVEKPQEEAQIDSVAMDPAWIDARGIPSQGRDCLASMGIYLFNKEKLVDTLRKTTYEDFGKQIFPAAIRNQHVQVHLFDGYWEDIGTIRAFYEANLALARHDPPFNLALPEEPIYSRGRFLPPSQIRGGQISQSLIADGCRIGENCVIENSVIGHRCFIGDGVTIRNSILMGADYYETKLDHEKRGRIGLPPLGIGSGSVIDSAIIDKNCRIGQNVTVQCGNAGDTEIDTSGSCLVREGIPVVVKDGTLPDGWKLE